MNKNKVELIGSYGGDLSHALSAWTSTSRELSEEKFSRIDKLLNMLASSGHETPFEKSTLHFLVTTDIATHIHLLKHRVGVSVNAECLEGNTLIYFLSPKGHYKKIKVKDIYSRWTTGRKHQQTEKDIFYCRSTIKNMRLKCVDEATGFIETSSIKDIWKTEKKKIYKITLENGRQIACSNNHPILTRIGWKNIENGLVVGCEVACNGVSVNVPNRPWTFREFYSNSEKYTRHDFAKLNGIKYELCKKWGYIFNIIFKEDENKDYKKGNKPWNDGVTGYKIDIADRKHNPRRGSKSHFWRGGITKERALIGVWTTRISHKIHKKYNFTCQNCGKSSGQLYAHHIIPVAQDISKARDENNLITVCYSCHKTIHSSLENEQVFAKKVLDENFTPFQYQRRIGPKKQSSLKYVFYSKIKSIKFWKEEECYDIEVDGENKNYVANGIVCHNSARYRELKDKFYIPEDWDNEEIEKYCEFVQNAQKLYHETYQSLLNKGFSKKRAKESSRFYLPYGTQITSDISFNFRSFVHFQRLRNSEHAQLEVRVVAQQMLEEVKKLECFNLTIKAFNL